MASANENAIGTPANTVPATTSTKKITRLNLPRLLKIGWHSQNSSTSPATMATAASAFCQLVCVSRRSKATTAIRPMPTGSAAARQALLSSIAGVVIKASSSAYS